MPVHFQTDTLHEAKWHEYASRFVLGGAITALAGIIAKEAGPAIGGLFLAFPAILTASLTLIEKHERERKAHAGVVGNHRARQAAAVDSIGAALGSLGLMVFAALTWVWLPRDTAWFVLPAATLAWFFVSAFAWWFRKRRWTAARRRFHHLRIGWRHQQQIGRTKG
jgi:Protein of unknown function (DUF3147)